MRTFIPALLIISCIVSVQCSRDTSNDVALRSRMLTRSWTGDEFLPHSVIDSSTHNKDFVATFEFKDDGSYFLYKFDMSGFGKTGVWKLENDGTAISLTDDDNHAESFSIRELTSNSLVLGDTGTHGYRLVPLKD